MAKHKIRNVNVFKTDISSFYQNIFHKMGIINFPQTILEKYQGKYHPDNLHFQPPCSSIKVTDLGRSHKVPK